MDDSEKITVSKPDDTYKLGFQSSVSNSDQDPLQCDSDHATDNASLHEHLLKSLSLNADREPEGKDEEKIVAVKISNEEERGDEVEAKSEESNGDIKANENGEKAQYDWIGAEDPEKKAEYDRIDASKHEKQDEYDWAGADEPEKRVENDWIGTDKHEIKDEYGWNGAGQHENAGEYGWNGADGYENKGEYGWNGDGWNSSGGHENKGEYGWNDAGGYESKGEYGWNGAGEHENKGEFGWNGADEDKNRDGRYDNGSYYGSSENKYARKCLYPVRPEAEDCPYYMRTGTCKFGSHCKFNHPVKRKSQAIKERVKEREDLPENPGQTECKYYLKTGGCKFGNACRYNHSRVPVTVVHQSEELNFLGLPIRPGERECPYYMRNGSCKYGANCRFNHPDPTAARGSDPASGYGNGEAASLQSTSQSSVASWHSPRVINETPPFVPVMFSPAPVVPPQSPEWNGFQAPLYPPERSIPPPPAYVMTNTATETNAYTHHQELQMLVDQFPERPGQSECTFYMKTGDCKFKMNCKFHHPKSRISKSLPCALSDIGLPLRPDQKICSHYSRYGICKFGPSCKFDHPIQQSPSTVSSSDHLHSFGDSVTGGEDAMASNGKGQGSANGTHLAVRQPV